MKRHEAGRQYDSTFKVFDQVVDCAFTDTVPYDQLDPVRNSNPTPLDPHHIILPYPGGFVEYAQRKLHTRAAEACRKYNIVNSSDAALRIHEEVAGEGLTTRINRNDEAMTRLLESVCQRGVALDKYMQEIILKARAGNANPSELLRLVKEYPDVTVEFFKFVKPLDESAMSNAWSYLRAQVIRVRREFRDAEISVYPDGREPITSWYIDPHGVLVTKYRMGVARSAWSDTEIIAKKTQLIMPPDEQIGGEPGEIKTITTDDGTRIDMNLYTLGLSAYYRSVDHKQRRRHQPTTIKQRVNTARDVVPHRFVRDERLGRFNVSKAYLEGYRAVAEAGASPRKDGRDLYTLGRSQAGDARGLVRGTGNIADAEVASLIELRNTGAIKQEVLDTCIADVVRRRLGRATMRTLDDEQSTDLCLDFVD